MVFIYISRDTPNQLKEIEYHLEDSIYQEIVNWVTPILDAYE